MKTQRHYACLPCGCQVIVTLLPMAEKKVAVERAIECALHSHSLEMVDSLQRIRKLTTPSGDGAFPGGVARLSAGMHGTMAQLTTITDTLKGWVKE